MASSSKTIAILPTPNTLEESWNMLRDGTDQMMTRPDEGMTYSKYMQLYTFVHLSLSLLGTTIHALADSCSIHDRIIYDYCTSSKLNSTGAETLQAASSLNRSQLSLQTTKKKNPP
jgi:hypothetical protein